MLQTVTTIMTTSRKIQRCMILTTPESGNADATPAPRLSLPWARRDIGPAPTDMRTTR